MEYFDKNIGNEFHQEFDSSIPEGFEWNAMKPGIKSKMSEAPKRRKRFILWFFLVAGILVSGTIYLSITGGNSSTHEAIAQDHKSRVKSPTTDHQQITNKTSPQTLFATREKNNNPSSPSKPSLQDHTRTKAANANVVPVTPTPAPRAKLDPQQKGNPSKSKQQLSDLNKDQSTQQANTDINIYKGQDRFKSNTNKNQVEEEKKVQTEATNYSNLEVASSIKSAASNATTSLGENKLEEVHPQINKITFSSATFQQLSLIDIPLFSILDIPIKTAPSLHISNVSNKIELHSVIGISAGVSLWNGKYKGDAFASKRNTSITRLPGFHINVNKGVPINDQFQINIGLGYQELYDQFDAQVQVSQQKEFKNALLRSHKSLLTGRVTETRSDTVVTSNEIKTVRHYNSFKTVSLDFSAAKKWKISSKSGLLLSVGPSISILTHASGKTLGANDSIIEFDASNQLYKTNHWAVNTGLSYQYSISNRCRLQASTSIKKYLSNISKEKNITFSPTVYQFSLGINVTL